MQVLSSIVALSISAAATAASAVDVDDSRTAGAESSRTQTVKAAHWFGEAWPVNFWNTDLESLARDHFELLLQDGFNTVVFLVPWPGFAPDPTSGELDPVRVRRLRELMLLADEMGLGTIVRVSYAWDWLDRRSGDRLRRLWVDDAYYRGWLAHLESLWSAVGDLPGFRFGFFSWEDLWAVTWYETADASRRRRAALDSGFAGWLDDNYGLDSVRDRFGSAADEAVRIPRRRDPAYGLFLEFVSEMWVQRFFRPAQQRFPKLSMEVRVDSDPIYDGERIIEWFDHRRSWDLPGAEWITTYWAPSMGGENRGELLSPETAAQRLAASVDTIAQATGPKQIFIGQFLFEDFTPGYEMNGRIPSAEVPEFLELAPDVLTGRVGGVGVWTWVDYAHDAIANPEFFAGLQGWESGGGADLAGRTVALESGGWIATDLQRFAYSIAGRPDVARLCVRARATGEGARLLAFQDDGAEPFAVLEYGAGMQRQCVEHALGARKLRLEADGKALVARVNSTGFVQRSGLRDRAFDLKPAGQAYRRLNAALGDRPRLRQPRFDDGWMGRLLVEDIGAGESADESVEESVNDPADRPGSRTHLRLLTHLPEDWPEPAMLEVVVDGERIGRLRCGDGALHRLALPAPVAAGETVAVRIEASSVHRTAGDDRLLGCHIVELRLDRQGAASED